MPNKIDTTSIIRNHEDRLKDSADQSNAEYVTQLEKSSSIMPPKKPFETEQAQVKQEVREDKDPSMNNNFVQDVKSSTHEIEHIDKANETKLHLLNGEYQKVADKLKDPVNKKDKASLEQVLNDVQDKIELYKSKLKAGIMTSGSIELEPEITDEDGEGDGISDVIMDGLKDQVLTAAPGVLLAAKDDEEEEKEDEIQEKEHDQ